jgi:hypothetical protein
MSTRPSAADVLGVGTGDDRLFVYSEYRTAVPVQGIILERDRR